MEALSDTESEPEQFPTEPVVEEQSLEKKPKRKFCGFSLRRISGVRGYF